MDIGFVGKNRKVLVYLVIASFGLWFTNDLLDIIKEKQRIKIWCQIKYRLTEESYEHVMKLKMKAFDKINETEILNNLNVDINNMSAIADGSMFFIIMQVFSMIGGIIGLIIIVAKLAGLVLLFIPIKSIIIRVFARKRKHYVDRYIAENRKYARWFGDSVGGVKEVRVLNLYKQKKTEFTKMQSEVIENQQKLELLGQWNVKVDSVLVQLLTMAIYIIGAEMVFDLKLSIGSIFAFITYSTYVTTPITGILNIGYLLAGIIPSTKRYYQFMELEEEVYDGKNGNIVKNGDIEFRDVDFSYDGKNDILSNINFTIPVKSKIALIGLNGSGKSTLMDLLVKIYDVKNGCITLNGVNINDYPLSEYRSLINVVSQKVYLFNDSILNNICLGKKIESKKFWKIIEDCGLSEDVNKEILNQAVGTDGCMLSGGQKQKIALARALINKGSIFIFDEITSNVDLISEKQINKLLKERLKNKTVIMATHKVSILKDVDKIILVNDGIIEAQGTYGELIMNNKLFQKIISTESMNINN